VKLLLAPHCDDETLFASYILLREQPKVAVCFNGRRARHLPRDSEREQETVNAMQVLGCDVVFCRATCDPADWYELETALAPIRPERVWAPLPEPGGNLGHNGVGNLAAMLWPGLVRYYTTYGAGNERTTIGKPFPTDPSWPDKKLKAMSCYASQRMKPDTAFHFTRPLDEYVVHSPLRKRGHRLNLGGGINPIKHFDNRDKSNGWRFEDGLGIYGNGSVEAITISHALMYVGLELWLGIFDELYRVLEPGGILRVTEDAIGAEGSSRPIIRPGAAVATNLELVKGFMDSVGFDPHELSPNASLFYDATLIQQNYGDPPDVFHVEGIKH
jgi:LmbE family N-acetylglucosaminyl deacetylase